MESVVRETCELILTEPGVPREKLVLRAAALEIAADAFLSIKKADDPTIHPSPSVPEKAGGMGTGTGDDYVKVDTPSSKEREAGFTARPPPPPPPPRPVQPQAESRAQPPHIPARPGPTAGTQAGEESGKQETLHAAYKACKSVLHPLPVF